MKHHLPRSAKQDRKRSVGRIQQGVAASLTVLLLAMGESACGGGSNSLTSALPNAASNGGQLRQAMSLPVSYQATVLADAPTGYWRLDAASGSSFADSSGNGHSGTVVGAVTHAVAGALSGDADTAASFTGGSISAPVPSLNSAYSLEAWFKVGSTGEEHFLDMSPQQMFVIRGQVYFGTGGGHYLKSALSTYGDNNYHHVVATYNGSTKQLFVDGVLAASSSDTVGYIKSSSLSIGQFYAGGYSFIGSLDEVAVYSKVLTAAQILNHFSIGHVVTPTPAPTGAPTPAATINPLIAKHVLTADYVVSNGGTTVAPSLLGPSLSWAETTWQDNAGVRSAGIKAMYYTDPNRIGPSDEMRTSDETAYTHTCTGSRIHSTFLNQDLSDPASASMRTTWKNYIAAKSAGVVWDAIFEDDTNNVLFATGTPCGYTSAGWLASSQSEDVAMGSTPVIYNGLQVDGQMGLNSSANVLGGMYEGCYSDSTTYPKIWDVPFWLNMENTEIKMAQQNKLFMCLTRDTTNASSAIDARKYVYASFMLTYSASTSMLWELYGTTSRYHVLPESKLVVANPLIATPSDVSGLKLSSGVYGREYANCYIGGTSVGACATVVNPDRYNSHSYPYGTKYTHTIVLSGGGIIDGGTVATNGSAPATTVPALGSAIVFQ
ncbi:MAG: LamG domain-containing protein [Candidatus Eremiobacter antarcticus]|nr:LamG domain-containing protein [Candidatus Eremiobacteraeota bacterium]MBC5808428.1 LamG domain-containing protein [Candidatus Eremiobacteraeota bacterium]